MNSTQYERICWARTLGVTDYGGRRPQGGGIQPRDGFPVLEPEFLPMPPLSDPCPVLAILAKRRWVWPSPGKIGP